MAHSPVSEHDRHWAQAFTQRHAFPGALGRPLWILQPWLDGHGGPMPVTRWDEVIRPFLGKARFWQVGRIGDSAVQGCEYYQLTPELGPREIQRIEALMSLAQGMIGVDPAFRATAQLLKIPLHLFLPEKPGESDLYLGEGAVREAQSFIAAGLARTPDRT